MLKPRPSPTWGCSSCSCSTTAAAIPQLATRASQVVARRVAQQAGGTAVLERADRIEEMHPTSYELLTDRDWSKEFAEYTRATQQLDELASLQAELMSSVETMDSLLTPQQSALQGMDTPEARRARRQESRAARKSGQAVPATAAAATAAIVAQPGLRGIALPASPVLQPPLPPPTQLKPKRTSRVAAPGLSTTSTEPAAANQAAVITSLNSSSTSSTSLSLVKPSTLLPQASTSSASTSSTSALQSGLSLIGSSSGSTAREKQRARSSRGSVQRVNSTAIVAEQLTAGRSGSASSGDGTTQFLKNASSTALLKPEQQKEVAVVVKDFLTLKSIEKELTSILKRKPTMQEWAKAVKMDDPRLFQVRLKAGQDAKALMLKSNYRLVIKVVKAYQNRGLSLQDLIAEGLQGLLRGVEKFEVDKGFRFSTYAHWWIRQAVTRALQEQGRAVRLPTHIHEQIVRISLAKTALAKRLGRAPTMTELSQSVGISEDKIPEILAASHQALSLESPVAGDDDGAVEMKDMLADERSQPDEVFADDMIRENLDAVLQSLNPREAGVLRMHWGLDGSPEMTLEEIGAHFKITRERVRQLEARALRQLKEHHSRVSGGVMQELQHISVNSEPNASSRASRGTRKS